MNLQATLGRAVTFYCRSLNITDQELARRMGTSRPYVTQVRGGRYNLSLEKVGEFAAALGVTPSHLLMEYPCDTKS